MSRADQCDVAHVVFIATALNLCVSMYVKFGCVPMQNLDAVSCIQDDHPGIHDAQQLVCLQDAPRKVRSRVDQSVEVPLVRAHDHERHTKLPCRVRCRTKQIVNSRDQAAAVRGKPQLATHQLPSYTSCDNTCCNFMLLQVATHTSLAAFSPPVMLG